MTDQTPGAAQSASVTARMPRVGPAIASGSRVVVRVSRGPSPAAPPAYVNVPTLLGTLQGDALGALQELGLVVEVLDDHSGSVPRGQVMGQLPHAGETTAAGSQAVLLVSSGPSANPSAEVGLPIVDGMTEAQAASVLQASGLRPQVVREFSSNVPEGIVIDQLPSAASLSEAPPPKKRSLVWLWVLIALVLLGAVAFGAYALTNRTALVPSVVGMSQADAQAAITAAGFKVGTVGTTQTASAADVGKVTTQSPAPNSQAKPKSAIDIVVSGGQKLLNVPNVVGMTEANAQAALKDAGLTSESTKANSSSVPKGSVISQAPPAGQQVPPGTSVGITISQGAASAAVPNVVGETQSQAQDALKAAGLGSTVVTNYNTAPKGQVYKQTPSAGTLVAPGTVVTISISNGTAPAPTQVTVPNVIGKAQADATQQLQNLGFEVSVSQVASGPAGQVVEQTPSGGTKADQGSIVKIVVPQ